MAVLGFLAAAGEGGVAKAAASQSVVRETPEQMIARAETLHPASLYQLAAQLLGVKGRADEAVKWFYIGQLRYRFHLAATRQASGANDRILFSALNESVGRPINEYAFGDVDSALAQIDEALLWDAAHDNHLTSKTRHAEKWAEIRQGLSDLSDSMLAKKEEIRRTRTKNGLPNR